MHDGISVLTEANFINNIKNVIGVEAPFFGKMMYLYFANGYDKVKVTMAMFVEGLKPYIPDDDRQKQN